MGTQSTVLLLGVPAEVFQAVTVPQRWGMCMHVRFKAHPYTGLRYCLRKPKGA